MRAPHRKVLSIPHGTASTEEFLAALRTSGSVFPDVELTALSDAAASATHLAALVALRVDGTPMQYLLGRVQFAGIRVHVREGVFNPRPRTEFLARLAVSRLSTHGTFLDLGCGAGPVAAYVAHHRPAASITAVDRDPHALDVARDNLPTTATIMMAEAPHSLAGHRFDVIAANLPYVPSHAIPLLPFEAREREPRDALDGGPDGLKPLRAWAGGLPELLNRGGRFLVEVSHDQAPMAASIVAEAFSWQARVKIHRHRRREATVVELLSPEDAPSTPCAAMFALFSVTRGFSA